ncbi:MAG: hypothetical protein IPJ71_02515 [Bdellovibrionales bacterium]|nr:hypothetical protein [Bdellovibrionales bacterium]
MSDLFQVVDEYNNRNRSKLICVPAEPSNQLAVRCGQAFADWRNHHFKKLFNENGKIELSDKVIDASQWPELEKNYARLLAHFEKTVDCAQDKVERCRALNRIREGTYGNGVSWNYDSSTNTSSATIPGVVGTASFSGKPKGGAFFSGEMVDPDFQRSECANVLAAATDIKKSWDAVPASIKLWARDFRQKSDGVVPVNEREPSRRGGKAST